MFKDILIVNDINISVAHSMHKRQDFESVFLLQHTSEFAGTVRQQNSRCKCMSKEMC